MEQANKDILDRNASEKMCSSVGNEAGEICSSADADTCRDYRASSEEQPNIQT